MARDVLGLPFLGVPMMAHIARHPRIASRLVRQVGHTAIKWSTAGDFEVRRDGRRSWSS